MEKIKIDINRFQVGKKIKGPNSPWSEVIENVIKFMGEDNKRFPYWCGRLKRFKESPNEINDILKEAKNFLANPQALFNKIVKERTQKMKDLTK